MSNPVTATAVIASRAEALVHFDVTLRDTAASLTGPVALRGGCALYTDADPIRAYLAICTEDQRYTVRAMIRRACIER